MLMVDLSAYKPPPLSTAVHPLIVPPLMVTVEEFFAYKPPPLSAEHSLIVPLLMVTAELSAYKPPPLSAVHPLIVPPSMINFDPPLTEITLLPPALQSLISPSNIWNVAPEPAITARLHFSITPPCMLKTEFSSSTTQAWSTCCLFCSVTFSYIYAVAPPDTVIKAPFAFPSIVSFLS